MTEVAAKKKGVQSTSKALLQIVIGNICMGFAYAQWMKPSKIINGGVTSVAMILSKATHLNILIFTYGVTGILLLCCLLFLGRTNFLRSLFSSICYTSFFSIFYLLPIDCHMNLPLDFLFSCVVIAFGYACCIKANASTVGMDVIALIVHKKVPAADLAKMIRWLNFVVLAFGVLVYGWSSVLIGVLFSYCNTWVLQQLLKKGG